MMDKLVMELQPKTAPRELLVFRAGGILFGVTTHLWFLATVWYLFPFLSGTPGTPSDHALWIDACLTLQFAISHSLYLSPPARVWLGRWLSRSFYGCSFCLLTCVSLSLVMWQWRTVPMVVWQMTGVWAALMWAGYIACWVGLFYSLALSGMGYQTGLTELLHWFHRRPLPRRTFTPRGAYFVLRHPVYLSVLGLLWFTPTMTLDHALMTGIWSAYIFIGSWLKDRRLAFYLGDSYREYAAQVPGYPGMLFGPLARWRRPDATKVSTVDRDPQPATV